MKTKDSWFIEQRAVHLAILHLTRRGDLVVTQPNGDNGLDILVEICKNGKTTGRMFGVQTKARQHLQITSSDSSLGVNEVKVSIRTPAVLKDLPFPLCLFIFQMENDEGYYKWINEPTIDSETHPKLVPNKDNIFKMLTKGELDNLIKRVNTWYERRHTSEYQKEVHA